MSVKLIKIVNLERILYYLFTNFRVHRKLQIICIFCIISSYSAAILYKDFDDEKAYMLIHKELMKKHPNEINRLQCVVNEIKKEFFAESFHQYSTKGQEEIEEEKVFQGQLFEMAVENIYKMITKVGGCVVNNNVPNDSFHFPNNSD